MSGRDPSYARTWYITSDGTGNAPTIAAGVDSAAAGDTVHVGCGEYFNEDVLCTRPLTLLGEDVDCVVVGVAFNSSLRVVGTEDVVLAQIHFRQNGSEPVRDHSVAYIAITSEKPRDMGFSGDEAGIA